MRLALVRPRVLVRVHDNQSVNCCIFLLRLDKGSYFWSNVAWLSRVVLIV